MIRVWTVVGLAMIAAGIVLASVGVHSYLNAHLDSHGG